jgi:hypothetical protein
MTASILFKEIIDGFWAYLFLKISYTFANSSFKQNLKGSAKKKIKQRGLIIEITEKEDYKSNLKQKKRNFKIKNKTTTTTNLF